MRPAHERYADQGGADRYRREVDHQSNGGIAYDDLHRACLHEAAHCAVALHLGHIAQWLIFKTDVSDWRDGSFYIGRTYLFSAVEDPTQRRLIGLAGSLAGLLDDDYTLDALEAVIYLDDRHALSDTDAELAVGYSEDDVAGCLCLLRECWERISTDAQRRIEVEGYIDCLIQKRDQRGAA